MSKRTLLPALALSIALGGVAWVRALHGKSGGSLATRDYIDIQQLYARYYHAIDASDAEGWAETFTHDGVFNNVKGHDVLVEYIKRDASRWDWAIRSACRTPAKTAGIRQSSHRAVRCDTDGPGISGRPELHLYLRRPPVQNGPDG